ncbi:MAG: GtrA family protein [Propionibacteriaceae bacterium]|nr:GtrA family protein [Propionibacteriaceae bacterium]
MTSLRARASALVHDGALLRYIGVGIFNSLLDLGLYTLFSVAIGIPPLIANIMSTTVTLCVSYFLNRRLVFRSTVGYARSAAQFVVVTLFSGLVVQSCVIWVVTHGAPHVVPQVPSDLVKVVAKLIAMGVGMVTNYVGYHWLFTARREQRGRTTAQGPQAQA